MPATIPADTQTSLPKIIQAIRDLASGRSNANGKFTLATTGTTTTVKAPGCGTDSHVTISPKDADAQAAGAYVSTVARGSFIVTHSAAATARGFTYGLQG